MAVYQTNSVGIVGSGIMAAGIAEVSARAGLRAVLRARSQDSLNAALKQITSGLNRQVEKGKLDTAERDRILSNITTTT